MMFRRQPGVRRLVFVGNYGNRNVGDDAILHVLSERYARDFPGYQQYVFARHFPADVRRVSQAEPLPTSIRAALWVLARVDVVVIGGGGLFYAHIGPVARFIPLFALLCWLLGKTVIYESVGFYSNTRPVPRLLVYLSMLTAASVSVRDRSSWRMTAPLRRLRAVSLVDDPGLAIEPVDRDSAIRLLRREGIEIDPSRSPVVGLSIKRIIRDRATTESVEQAVVETCQWLVDQGYTVLFVPFCHDPQKWAEQDVEFAQEVIAKLERPERVHCLTGYYTPREVAAVVALTDAFIGMRFHAQVFAHALGVPLIPIAHEEKRMDFIRQHGYPLVPIDHLTSHLLIQQLRVVLSAAEDEAATSRASHRVSGIA